MGATILGTTLAAAIGAIFGLVIGYIVFESYHHMISVGFIDWMTNVYYVGGRNDAIFWASIGAGVASALNLMFVSSWK